MQFYKLGRSITGLTWAIYSSNSTSGPSPLFSRLWKTGIHGPHHQASLSACAACGGTVRKRQLSEDWLAAHSLLATQWPHLSSTSTPCVQAPAFTPLASKDFSWSPWSLHFPWLLKHSMSYLIFPKSLQNRKTDETNWGIRTTCLRHRTGNRKAKTRIQVF